MKTTIKAIFLAVLPAIPPRYCGGYCKTDRKNNKRPLSHAGRHKRSRKGDCRYMLPNLPGINGEKIMTSIAKNRSQHVCWILIGIISIALSSFDLTKATNAFGQEAGKRIYKIHCDQLPAYCFYGNEDKSEVTGLWIDMVRSTMDRMGEKYEKMELYPWARLFRMGLRGEVDGMLGAKTPEREKYLWFTDEPLIRDPWVFFIRKSDVGTLKFDSYNDLKGHQVGLMTDFAYTDELWKFVKREKNYEEVPVFEQNLHKLLSGRVDYIVNTLNIGICNARQMGILDQISPLTERVINDALFYVMFNKKNVSKAFVDRFSENLAAFKKTPEYKTLLTRYGIGDDFLPEK